MTDLEITKLCAEALGLEVRIDDVLGVYYAKDKEWKDMWSYRPLHDDAQAMALLKQFPSTCLSAFEQYESHGGDLNRAICECVAKMQAAAESR